MTGSWQKVTVLLAALGSSAAYAETGTNAYYDTAKVLDVVPVVSYERVATPRRECTKQPVTYRAVRDRRDFSNKSPVSGLLGGLIGGAIGNQFGDGNGRKAMTVIGALAGASIASEGSRQAARQRHSGDYYVRDGGGMNCRTIQEFTERERIEGYQVTYEYLGELYEKTLPQMPGDTIEIRVEMTPVVGASWESDGYVGAYQQSSRHYKNQGEYGEY